MENDDSQRSGSVPPTEQSIEAPSDPAIEPSDPLNVAMIGADGESSGSEIEYTGWGAQIDDSSFPSWPLASPVSSTSPVSLPSPSSPNVESMPDTMSMGSMSASDWTFGSDGSDDSNDPPPTKRFKADSVSR